MNLISNITKTFKSKKTLTLNIFIIINYLGLIFDILYAHSINKFAHWGEYIPLYFCIIATLVIPLSLTLKDKVKNVTLITISIVSIFIGIWGVIFHLESQFFQDISLKSLVYTAPFVAPLSFAGLGFLLLLNQMIPSSSKSWAIWVILLAYIGFLGNFILSLCDHEQNGFFHITEWIPIISSALILGFIPYYIFDKTKTSMKNACHYIVGIQLIVGVLGFILHGIAILKTNFDITFWEKVLYGAPLMAPLLFTILGILMYLGMVAYDEASN